MLQAENYTHLEKAAEENGVVIYKAFRKADGVPVEIKTPGPGYQTASVIADFKRQYDISQRIGGNSTVKIYGVELIDSAPALIGEAFDGISLRQAIGLKELALSEFIEVSIKIVEALHEIHKAKVIHHNLNPDNILINAETGVVKITDFSIATPVSTGNGTIDGRRPLGKNSEYSSLEQTGRINRPVDYGADLYSLGVVFYELLTGRLPFTAGDELGLIHCHLAVKPVPPRKMNPDIPQAISDLVLKLMEKAAEDRYRSALGLIRDLTNCRDQWRDNGRIEPFRLGVGDIAEQFPAAHKLYGREDQVELLLAGFERISGGTKEVLMVTGYTGIGKSSLVYEIRKAIIHQNGYFISGKFDQFQHDIPYAALVQAFKELARQVLTRSEAEIVVWKKTLLKALGQNGRIITGIIPEMELIIGKQLPLLELPPEETKERFNMVFRKFVRVCGGPWHPLVIFLDDLQWADLSSLKLLEVLLGDLDLEYMLFIGAYRDNEVGETHPLKFTLNKLQKERTSMNSIRLEPLALANIQQLLAEVFKREPEAVAELAGLCIEKTEGNPFFLHQFLYSLYQENLIRFDFDLQEWRWDLPGIRNTNLTDNVVELISARIGRLAPDVRESLKMAACIGNKFDLKTLAVIRRQTLQKTGSGLRPALQENILSLVVDFADDDQSMAPGMRFEFLHDRIQQAAYSLIAEEDRPKVHLTIGRLMLSEIDRQANEELLLDIVNHLNLGINLLEDGGEKEKIARLELLAGRKSKQAIAYEAAYQYYQTGISLVEEAGWETRYDLTFSLHIEAGEAAYLTGNFAKAEEYLQMALEKSQTILDKIKVYEISVAAYSAQNKLDEAIAIAVAIFKLININIPHHPGKPDLIFALAKTKWLLLKNRPENLLNMPPMTEPVAIAVDRVAIKVGVTAYKWDPNFFVLYILKLFNEFYPKYGNSTIHNNIYTCLGFILCTIGDIDLGYKIGELSLKTLDRLTTSEYKPFAYQNFYTYIAFWKMPLKMMPPPLLEVYFESMELGNTSVACLGIFDYCFYSFFAGKRLAKLQDEMALYSDAIYKTKNKELLAPQLIFQQTVLNLRGLADNPHILKGEIYDPERMLPLHFRENDLNPITCFYACSLMLSYLFGDYDRAFEDGQAALKYIDGLIATVGVQYIYIYATLAILAQFGRLPLVKRWQALKTLLGNERKIRKWAAKAGINFGHMYYLIKAEKARLWKRDRRAMAYYDKAIAEAVDNEGIREEALANELAAKFYLSRGNRRWARFYILDAYAAYRAWGATAKVKQLENRYFHLLRDEREPHNAFEGVNPPEAFPESDYTEKLDLETIKKASQAISGEIVLENLLERLIKIVLENAGADRVFLLLRRDDKLYIEASGDVNQNRETTILQARPAHGGGDLPESIVNYVSRTKESLVLDDAAETEQFLSDSYLKRNRPKSVLCMPIVNQGELKGLLYLENNLVNGVFTQDRIAVLNVLASQLAISIENALFYSRLDELVNQRRDQLANELEDLNHTERGYGGRLMAGMAREVNLPQLGNLNSLKRTVTELKLNLIHPVELADSHRILSKREAEVAELLCQRLSMAEIATVLRLSPRTIQGYVENIKEKLGAKSKREIIEKLLREEG